MITVLTVLLLQSQSHQGQELVKSQVDLGGELFGEHHGHRHQDAVDK